MAVQLSGGREKSQTRALMWELLGEFRQQQGGPVTFTEYMRGKHEIVGMVVEGHHVGCCRSFDSHGNL